MESNTQMLLAEPRLQLFLAAALCILATTLLLLAKKRATEPPGPKFVIPLLGEMLHLLVTSPLTFQWSRLRKYGPVFRTHLIGQPVYITTDADALRRIAKNEGVQFVLPGRGPQKMFGFSDQMLHRKWHTQWRKYILMAIGPAGIEDLFPKLQAIVDRYVADWESQGRFCLQDQTKEMAFDFGVDVIIGMDIPNGINRTWFKQKVMEVVGGLYGMFPFDVPGTLLHRGLAAKRAIGEAFKPALAELIAQVNLKAAELGDKDPDPGVVLPLMEATLLTSKGYSDVDHEQAMDRLVGNVMAATDTTRYMLWITMSLAAKSPRIIEKLREEQAALVVKHGPKITYKALQEMVYLEATVKEAMRIMPASIFTFRTTTEPFPVGKYVIPKGATIALSSILPQALDPVMWGGPPDFSQPIPPHMDWQNNFDSAFRPERWLPDSPAKPRAYNAFGSGEFQCLGMNLAYAEAKLVMASILRRYRYSFVDPDWLLKCNYFPGPRPRPGTDLVDLVLDPVPGC